MSYGPVEPLGRAIVETIVYGDLFDYPMKGDEIGRYLIGREASASDVAAALETDALVAHHTSRQDGFHFLQGREAIVGTRRARAAASARVWPRAIRYGRLLAHLPFVRMVAVTGALAVDNFGDRPDIDYLIVTETGRLWYARAHVIALVRCVANAGDVICPNYLFSESMLALDDRNLFTAHEIAQMVPLSGFAVYERLRALNTWSSTFLPNATGAPSRTESAGDRRSWRMLQGVAERMGRTAPGERFERWEMTRKVRRFTAASTAYREALFTPDICKGHVDGHGGRILARFSDRIAALALS